MDLMPRRSYDNDDISVMEKKLDLDFNIYLTRWGRDLISNILASREGKTKIPEMLKVSLASTCRLCIIYAINKVALKNTNKDHD